MMNSCLLIFCTGFGVVEGLSEQRDKLDVAHVVMMGLGSGDATHAHVSEAQGAAVGNLNSDRI